ncbi:unnamed protein product [Caenorhabditis auriculariae]|uniref:BTB domain-containing protein n=1 Tax=Caenorhabditis auriculariae TaxID=2777116 RepID=A0A8S1HX40_9PELO|nr:unnamed protein product [Caenorhabditis auriculariae]
MMNPPVDVPLKIGTEEVPAFTDFNVLSLPWRARTYVDADYRFVVDIACCPNKFSTGWNVKANISINFVSNKRKSSETKTCSFSLQTKSARLYLPFASSAFHTTLQATITVLDVQGFVKPYLSIPSFDYSSPEIEHDEVFLVEGQFFYVQSQIVSLHSPILSKIIYEKRAELKREIDLYEQQISGIELVDVTSEEFRHFLNAIYPSRDFISSESVEAVLKLAEKYQATAVFPKCETFLRSIEGKKIDFVRRLDWATRFGMVYLQHELFKSLDSFEKLAKVGENPEWINMCETAKTGFMERLDWAARYRMNDLENDLYQSMNGLHELAKLAENPEWISFCESAKNAINRLFLLPCLIFKTPFMPPANKRMKVGQQNYYSAQVKDLKEEKSRIIDELHDLREERTRLIDHHRRLEEGMVETEAFEPSEQKIKLLDEVLDLRRERNKILDRTYTLQEQKNFLLNEVHDLKQEWIKPDVSGLRKERIELRDQLSQKSKECAEVKSELNDLKLRFNSLFGNTDVVHLENVKLKATLEELIKSNSELKEKLVNAHCENAKMNAIPLQLNMARAETKVLRRNLESLPSCLPWPTLPGSKTEKYVMQACSPLKIATAQTPAQNDAKSVHVTWQARTFLDESSRSIVEITCCPKNHFDYWNVKANISIKYLHNRLNVSETRFFSFDSLMKRVQMVLKKKNTSALQTTIEVVEMEGFEGDQGPFLVFDFSSSETAHDEVFFVEGQPFYVHSQFFFPKCERFLRSEEGKKICVVQRWDWAARYRMNDLQEDLYKSMNSLHRIGQMYSRPVKRKKPAVLERNRREIKDWKEEVETLGEERIVILRNHPQREREIKIPLHDPKEEPYEPADTKEQPKNLLAQLKKKSERVRSSPSCRSSLDPKRNESPLTVTTNEAQADAQLVNFKWRERTFFNEFSRCVVEITCRPKKLSNCWSVRANVGISYVYRHEKFSEMKTFTFNPLMPTVRIVLNKPRMNRNNTSSVRSLVGVLEIDGFEGLQEEIPTFDFANSETFHDEVFVVEGQPFYVQSQNVFVHSPVLERIVNEKKNEMKEDKIKKEIEEEQISGIELNDVTADEFRHFLNAIHPFRDGICAKNVGAVLRLAEMYEAASLFRENASAIDWAARYRMNDLENDLYQSMNGLHMLAQLGENPEWTNLLEFDHALDAKEQRYELTIRNLKEQQLNQLEKLEKKSECDRVKLELLTLKHRFETFIGNSDVLHYENARLQASVEELTLTNSEIRALRENLISLHNENAKLKASVEKLTLENLELEYLREKQKDSQYGNFEAKQGDAKLRELLHELSLTKTKVKVQRKNLNYLSFHNDNLGSEVRHLKSALSTFKETEPIEDERPCPLNNSPSVFTAAEAPAQTDANWLT